MIKSHIIRKLERKDFIEYTKHINSFVTIDTFNNFLDNVINEFHNIYVIIVDKKIVASGTLLIEKKLTHGGCTMAHIENILVDKKYRNNGLGQIIVKHLVDIAENLYLCYRVDLHCTEKLIPFYQKNGFKNNLFAMSITFEKNFTNL